MTDLASIARHWFRQTDKGRGEPRLSPTCFCDCCEPTHGTWLYFIQAVDGGPVKIGRTKKPKDRIWKLQDSSPVTLRFIALFRGIDLNERELHRHFAAERMRGEWFDPSEHLLAYAASRGIDSRPLKRKNGRGD